MRQLLDAAFVCRKCGNAVSPEQYKSDSFCPDCGTSLRPLRYWMFQFNPLIYQWHDWIKENSESEQWLASQHARKIRKGDRVAIWSSGNRSGVYAIGEIVADPSRYPLAPEQEKYYIQKADVNKFREKNSVMVKYLKIVADRPLLEDKCREDPVLSAMEILKQSQGTNFPLTREQWIRILELVELRTSTK